MFSSAQVVNTCAVFLISLHIYQIRVMNKDNTTVTANMFPFIGWNCFLWICWKLENLLVKIRKLFQQWLMSCHHSRIMAPEVWELLYVKYLILLHLRSMVNFFMHTVGSSSDCIQVNMGQMIQDHLMCMLIYNPPLFHSHPPNHTYGITYIKLY